MKPIKLLIVSKEEDNRSAIRQAFETQQYSLDAVASDEAAVEQFCRTAFDVVVAGNDLDDAALGKIDSVFKTISGEGVLVRQEDKDTATLGKAVMEAYRAKRRNSLRHIAVNDATDAKNMEGYIRLVNEITGVA